MGEEYVRELCKHVFDERSLSECAGALQKLKQLVKAAVLQQMEKCYEDPEACAKAVSSVNSVVHKLVFIVIPAVVDAALEELVEGS
jgi:hypothetical protein